MASYVLASVFMYRIGRLVTGSRGAGWVAAAVILFNPSLLYIQSTAMSETLSVSAFIVAVFYALRLTRTARAADIVKCAAAVAAGTLIRYENWVVAVALVPIIAYAAWRYKGYRMAEAWTILYGILAFAGCAGWVLYNAVIFHDPLAAFFYGNSSHTLYPNAAATDLPSRHRPWFALVTYGYGVLGLVGWVVVGLALAGFLVLIWRVRLRPNLVPLYLVLIPLGFYWLVLYLGYNTESLPELGTGPYYQVRFGLLMLPAIGLCLAFLVARGRRLLRRALVIGVLAAVVASSAVQSLAQTPLVLREAEHGAGAFDRTVGEAEARWLHAHYQHGNILITYINLAPMIFYLLTQDGFPNRVFITDGDGAQFTNALRQPEKSVTWIVMNTSPSNGQNKISLSLSGRNDWRRHFTLRASFQQEVGTTEIYELIDRARAPGL
jgi:hypothetical protein